MKETEQIQKWVKKRSDYFKQEYKPIKFSQKFINQLFEKYNQFSMVRDFYCCRSLEICCWQDVYQEGVDKLHLQDTKESILRHVKYASKYLHEGGRFYISEKEGYLYLFILTRDKQKK